MLRDAVINQNNRPGFRLRWTSFFVFVCCAVSMVSCDEQLPTREDPPSILVSSFSIEPGPAILEDSVSSGRGGLITMEVTNVHDEVLQDTALIRGTVELWMRTDTTKRATITFDERALQNITTLFRGVLTIRTGEKIYFVHQWSQRSDEGEFFWRYVPVSEKRDSQGNLYLLSDSLYMSARASIQVFKKVQPMKMPERQYTMFYIIR